MEEDGNMSDWVSDEDEAAVIIDLFSSKNFNNVNELIDHSREVHQFDIPDIIRNLNADDEEIAVILFVNFVRSSVEKLDGTVDTAFIEQLKKSIEAKEFLQDEKYMMPVFSNDSLLFLLGEAVIEFDENADRNSSNDSDNDWDNAKSKFSFFNQVKGVASEVEKDQTKMDDIRLALENCDADEPSDYYFGGYSHISIHETMLRDSARTNAYADALLKNKEFIKDKVVLDVGCGTGILCLLAAKAGAKKVIGVDMSSIIEKSKKIVSRNGFGDIITLMRGRLEDIDLPVEYGTVDIIVSEWMGYGLYFENMLPAVMYARDKYLKKDTGIVMPSDAKLFIEAFTIENNSDDRVAWWDNVYGFDMADVVNLFTAEAQVDVTNPDCIVTGRSHLHSLQIGRAIDEDLDFKAPFVVKIADERASQQGVKGFVISFDVLFAGPIGWNNIELSTAVASVPTHWKQVNLWLEKENVFMAHPGEEITGTVTYKRSEANSRDYVIGLSWSHAASGTEASQTFILA